MATDNLRGRIEIILAPILDNPAILKLYLDQIMDEVQKEVADES